MTAAGRRRRRRRRRRERSAPRRITRCRVSDRVACRSCLTGGSLVVSRNVIWLESQFPGVSSGLTLLRLRRRSSFGRAWPGLVVLLVRISRRPGQDDAARLRHGFQACGADGLFEVVDSTSEGGLSDAEVFGALLEDWCPGPVRRRAAAAEGEVEIRRVPEPAEYATLSPEHDEDYLRAQIATDEFPAQRRSIRRRPTHGRLALCGNCSTA